MEAMDEVADLTPNKAEARDATLSDNNTWGSGRSLAREKMVVAHSMQAVLLMGDIARKMFDGLLERRCSGKGWRVAMATSMSQQRWCEAWHQ